MDDFICDSDNDENTNIDVSAAIRETFKYDKNRFLDEDSDDLQDMETSTHGILKEEWKSKKLGSKEDAIELKKIEEEERREAAYQKMKKKKKK